MNRTERLQEVLRLEGLAAAAKSRAGEHRAALEDEARAELAREGSAPTWRMGDIGTITLPVSSEQPIISDIAALLAWCKERHPSEVQLIEQVRPSFQGLLLKRAVAAGELVVDGETGEIVPGMSVRHGGEARTLTIRATPDAKYLYAKLGERALDDLLAAAMGGTDA